MQQVVRIDKHRRQPFTVGKAGALAKGGTTEHGLLILVLLELLALYLIRRQFNGAHGG